MQSADDMRNRYSENEETLQKEAATGAGYCCFRHMVDNMNEFGCDPKKFSDVRNCAAQIHTEQRCHRKVLSEQRMCEPSTKRERADVYRENPDLRTSAQEVQRQPERARRRESERERMVRRESAHETERELESVPDTAVLRQRTVEKAAKQRLESSIRRRLFPKTGRRTRTRPTCNRKPIDVPSVDNSWKILVGIDKIESVRSLPSVRNNGYKIA